MNTTKMSALVLVVAMSLGAAVARAQTPNIVVQNKVHNGNRQISITVEDPAPRTAEAEHTIPGVVISAPDGGEIQGTMLVGARRYAVTDRRMLSIGDTVRGFRVTEISLDHVRVAGSARTYELDLESMTWTAGEDLAVSE